MLRRFIPVMKNKTLLFSYLLPSSIRSVQTTTNSTDTCSSTRMVDISSLTSKKTHKISVNNLVMNSRNIKEPLKKVRKLNHKLFSPEKPTECCNNQCECCVWLLYVKEIVIFYDGDKDKIEEALNCIPNTETQNYVRENYESFI